MLRSGSSLLHLAHEILASQYGQQFDDFTEVIVSLELTVGKFKMEIIVADSSVFFTEKAFPMLMHLICKTDGKL